MLEYGLFGCGAMLIVKDLSMEFQDGDYLHDGEKIIEFNQSSSSCLNGSFTPSTGTMTPIKLNDCVLNACGFHMKKSTTYINGTGIEIKVEMSSNYTLKGKAITYLHELQRECRKNNHTLSIDISALSKCVI